MKQSWRVTVREKTDGGQGRKSKKPLVVAALVASVKRCKFDTIHPSDVSKQNATLNSSNPWISRNALTKPRDGQYAA